MQKDKSDSVLNELQMIRKLMILMMMENGKTQGQIGAILGLTQPQVSGMFPKGALASLKNKPKAVSKVTPSEDKSNG